MLDDKFVSKIAELAAAGQGDVTFCGADDILGADVPVALLTGSAKLEDLERFLRQPRRIKAKPVFTDVLSFGAYVNAHKEHASTCFAQLEGFNFRAVLDYHEGADLLIGNRARWGDHAPSLKLAIDPDWQRWTELNGDQMSQTEFAQFLEEMAHTIEAPDAASIAETVLWFETKTDAQFQSVINRDTGSVTLKFAEDTTQVEGQKKLPTKMEIVVRPFRSASPVQLLVRVRYRVVSGKVLFTYVLDRPDRVEEEAFRQVAGVIADKTGIEPLYVA